MDLQTQKMFADILNGLTKNKVSPYATTATVTSVTDDIIYVDIPGCENPIPVKNSTVKVKAGDVVNVSISHGDTHITGNRTDVSASSSDVAENTKTIENNKRDADNRINMVNNDINLINNRINVQRSDIEAIDSKVDLQGSEIQSINSTLEVHGSKISSYGDSIVSQGNKIETLNNKVTRHDTSITELNSEMTSLNSKVTTQDSKIDTIDSDVKTQGSKISTLESTVQTQGSSIETLNSTVKTQGSKISTLDSTVKTQGSKIDTIDSDVKTQGSKISTLDSTVKTQGSSIETLNSTVKTQGSKIDTIDSDVKTQGSKISTLDSTVKTQGSSIETLNSTVKTQGSKISTLDSTVKTQGSSIETLDSSIKIVNSAFIIQNGKMTGISEILTNILDSDYVTTDLLNANVAWIENGKIKEGAIGTVEIHDSSITTAKIAELSADVIKTGTLKTECLILTTDEVDPKTGEKKVALITALNAKTKAGEGNLLDGAIVKDGTIEAAKITVVDLNAFGATIGNFHIGTSSIYNNKTALTDPTDGVYIGTDGIALGQGSLLNMTDDSPFRVESDGDFHLGRKDSNYINFDPFAGKLDINAGNIKMGSSSVATTANVTDAIDDIEQTSKSYTDQKADEITQVVSKKVGADEIISKINQTAETITIDASKLNLNGYVTIKNLKDSGATEINGANIITGSIKANKIDIADLFAQNITATSINVTGDSKFGPFGISSDTAHIIARDTDNNQVTIGTEYLKLFSGVSGTEALRIMDIQSEHIHMGSGSGLNALYGLSGFEITGDDGERWLKGEIDKIEFRDVRSTAKYTTYGLDEIQFMGVSNFTIGTDLKIYGNLTVNATTFIEEDGISFVNSYGKRVKNIHMISASNNFDLGYGGYDNKIGATNIYGNEIWIKPYKNLQSTRHLRTLWTGAHFMDASQTATLSDKVTNQLNGIVLVWSCYNSGAKDYWWNFTFVPKEFVSKHGGNGVGIILHGSPLGVKYIYINDNTINGVSDNGKSSINISGITFKPSGHVLREVLGV